MSQDIETCTKKDLAVTFRAWYETLESKLEALPVESAACSTLGWAYNVLHFLRSQYGALKKQHSHTAKVIDEVAVKKVLVSFGFYHIKRDLGVLTILAALVTGPCGA